MAEKQKPVNENYREGWNRIFGKEKKIPEEDVECPLWPEKEED